MHNTANTVAKMYQLAVDAGKIESDERQIEILNALDNLRLRLIHRMRPSSFPKRLFWRRPSEPEKGLYIWGGVGSGKTFLMDCLAESLPFDNKIRVHFHRFMQQVHGGLKEHAGHPNPLAMIAKQWAKQVDVLCFDEFLVHDIADAMLLGELLKQLFRYGVSLVATSNIKPDGLYMNGLQRRRFLPAIELLKQHTEAIRLDTSMDYRMRALEQMDVYYCPPGQETDQKLWQSMQKLTAETPVKDEVIWVHDRPVTSRYLTDKAAWFDFIELCDGPRSQIDNIEIARRYQTVILSNVPQLHSEQDDQMRRFIGLVDEFYDRNVKLILSAEVWLKSLYTGTSLKFEFERTKSRLIEMRSREFLARPHLA